MLPHREVNPAKQPDSTGDSNNFVGAVRLILSSVLRYGYAYFSAPPRPAGPLAASRSRFLSLFVPKSATKGQSILRVRIPRARMQPYIRVHAD